VAVASTVGYRVGAFGFLALDELSKEAGGTTGNYGTQDQT
jgi:para-nitrobenzyl esterase